MSVAVGIGAAFGLYAWRRCVQLNRLTTGRVRLPHRLASVQSDWAPQEAELLGNLHFLPR
ncbi:MAG TPA: hypothetical protein VFG50_02945 [Rhodothermales bacterium]|nr:hypothetical protein [Rhodothermales bacterium]